MEDHPQPANVEEQERAQNVEDPPQLVNVEDQQPPIANGHVLPLPHAADDQQFLLAPNQIQLIDLENHLVDVDNLAEIMNRHDEPPMNLDEIRQLLDVIDIVDDEEEDEANAPNEPDMCNTVNEDQGEHHHDDSDEEPDFEALAAIIYIGMMNKN